MKYDFVRCSILNIFKCQCFYDFRQHLTAMSVSNKVYYTLHVTNDEPRAEYTKKFDFTEQNCTHTSKEKF